MHYLVDTDVLLRLFDRSDPQHASIRTALTMLRRERHTTVVTPQNMAEFWNVSTRPQSSRGGYGISIEFVQRRAAFILRGSLVLPESPAIFPEWMRLVQVYGVSGVAVYDARIVAQLSVARIAHLITLNVRDFHRYADMAIHALTPDDVVRNVPSRNP